MRYRRVHQPGSCYFLTLVTYERSPLLAEKTAVDLFRASVAKVKTKRPFTLEAMVVLPDHLHMLWTLPDGDADYPTRVRLIKSDFTRALPRTDLSSARSTSRIAKHEQAVWQRRYWEHTIRGEEDFQAHLDYIHLNPVKHGLVPAARDWPFSTFADWVARGAYDPWWGSDAMPPLPAWAGKE